MLFKKIIVITGASKGIGKEIVNKFIKCKTNYLILNSRVENKYIKRLKKETNVKFIKGNISSLKTIKKVFIFLNQNRFKIDGMICNVGGGKNPKNGKEILINYKKSFEQNFFSTINIIYKLKKLFNQNSKIVCISSIASKSVVDTPIAYSVSKSALNSFIINFAKNFKVNKICITGVLPGHTMHENSVWFKNKKKKPILVKELMNKHMQTGEWIKPNDIAEITYFLINHSTNSFNGSLIELEGGITTK